MHDTSLTDSHSLAPNELYALLEQQLRAITQGETDWIANTANCAALLYHNLPQINWAGFYFLQGNELVLGPFQGRPACVRIPVGKGVCGTAAQTLTVQIVADVHQFPGHIACDSASNSEIVLPILSGQKLLGVLDIDSPQFNRFNQQDATGLQSLIDVLVRTYEESRLKLS